MRQSDEPVAAATLPGCATTLGVDGSEYLSVVMIKGYYDASTIKPLELMDLIKDCKVVSNPDNLKALGLELKETKAYDEATFKSDVVTSIDANTPLLLELNKDNEVLYVVVHGYYVDDTENGFKASVKASHDKEVEDLKTLTEAGWVSTNVITLVKTK